MSRIFEVPPDSRLAAAITEDWGLLPLRVPAGWNVVYNALEVRRLPDGTVEANDSEDLYWARTSPPPWLSAQEVAEKGGLRSREITIDAGWYGSCGFRVVVLDPGWEHERASHATSDLDEFVATLEAWMGMVTQRGELPEA